MYVLEEMSERVTREKGKNPVYKGDLSDLDDLMPWTEKYRKYEESRRQKDNQSDALILAQSSALSQIAQ